MLVFPSDPSPLPLYSVTILYSCFILQPSIVSLNISILQIVIILRGPPGSGKTHVAKLIKVWLFGLSSAYLENLLARCENPALLDRGLKASKQKTNYLIFCKIILVNIFVRKKLSFHLPSKFLNNLRTKNKNCSLSTSVIKLFILELIKPYASLTRRCFSTVFKKLFKKGACKFIV